MPNDAKSEWCREYLGQTSSFIYMNNCKVSRSVQCSLSLKTWRPFELSSLPPALKRFRNFGDGFVSGPGHESSFHTDSELIFSFQPLKAIKLFIPSRVRVPIQLTSCFLILFPHFLDYLNSRSAFIDFLDHREELSGPDSADSWRTRAKNPRRTAKIYVTEKSLISCSKFMGWQLIPLLASLENRIKTNSKCGQHRIDLVLHCVAPRLNRNSLRPHRNQMLRFLSPLMNF